MPLSAGELNAILGRVLERIVAAVRPRRIVLFGSAARGDMGPDSDIDLLVVMPDGSHRRDTTTAIHRSLVGVGFATEAVVATESDLQRRGSDPSSVYFHALREGREVYRESVGRAVRAD